MTLESIAPVSDNLTLKLPNWLPERPGPARRLPQRTPGSYTTCRDTIEGQRERLMVSLEQRPYLMSFGTGGAFHQRKRSRCSSACRRHRLGLDVGCGARERGIPGPQGKFGATLDSGDREPLEAPVPG